MGWLDLSLKNPHKIIDIEYQNPCNVCAALSFEGFQETREPSEDTPQGFRACHSDLFGGVGLNLFSFPNAIANSNVALSPKKNTIILMDVPLWDFFWLQRPQKKKQQVRFFQCKGLTTKVMEIIFVPDFNPRKSPKKCRGSFYYQAKKNAQLYWQNMAKPTPEITTTFAVLFWFSKKNW